MGDADHPDADASQVKIDSDETPLLPTNGSFQIPSILAGLMVQKQETAKIFPDEMTEKLRQILIAKRDLI